MVTSPVQVLGDQRSALDDELDDLRSLERTVTPGTAPPLSARLLERAARETDPVERKRLQDEVVVLHMGLARAIAARYRGRGIADDDLTQAASMALLKAARNFDPSRGVEFLSYAVVTMKGEVKRQFRDFGWMVRPPRPIQKLQADVSRADGELTHELGRSPRVSEVAAHLGVPEEDVLEALSADGCFTPTSLDTPVGAEGTGVLGELLPGDDSAMSEAEARVMLAPGGAGAARARARGALPALLQAADPGADRRGDRRHPDAGVPDPGPRPRSAARPARLTPDPGRAPRRRRPGHAALGGRVTGPARYALRQRPRTTYVRTASRRTCRGVHGKLTHRSWLNSRVWSLRDRASCGSIDSL